jgi:hypothetical protein
MANITMMGKTVYEFTAEKKIFKKDDMGKTDIGFNIQDLLDKLPDNARMEVGPGTPGGAEIVIVEGVFPIYAYNGSCWRAGKDND